MRIVKVLIMLVIFLFVSNVASAQNECFLLKFNFSKWEEYTLSVLQKNEILRQPELKKAYDFMNTYYVDNGNCNVQNDYIPDKRYPKTPFLLDYLVNIGFRKLDAIDVQIYPQLEPDVIGIERRNGLKELLKKQNPSATPGEIRDFYGQYRDIENGILLKRYRQVCEEAFDIWKKLVAPGRSDSEDTATQAVFNDFALRCEELVLKRAQQEMAFVKAQMQQQGDYIVNQQTERYLISYFDQQRLEEFLKKVHKIVGIWGYIVRVVKGTLTCNG